MNASEANTELRKIRNAQFAPLVLMIVFAASCAKPKHAETVIFDGWWAADYAKGSCEQAKGWWKENGETVSQLGCKSIVGCPEMEPIYQACFSDPVSQCRIFEDTLRGEFGSSTVCGGAEFLVLIHPDVRDRAVDKAMSKPHWSLIVDYVPGKQKQSWWLKRDQSNVTAQGEDSAKEIARKVCTIANGHGAKLSD